MTNLNIMEPPPPPLSTPLHPPSSLPNFYRGTNELLVRLQTTTKNKIVKIISEITLLIPDMPKMKFNVWFYVELQFVT